MSGSRPKCPGAYLAASGCRRPYLGGGAGRTMTTSKMRLAAFAAAFALFASLLPSVLRWDGIAFLLRAREPHRPDVAHLAYAPLLRWAGAALAPLGTSPELAARLVSCAAAAAIFCALWRRAERAGLPRLAALAAAGLVSTTPLYWRQAGLVDPGILAVASLLLAASAAEAYAERPAAGRLALASAALLAACAFHVVAVLATPWLVRCARGPTGPPPLRHVAVPLALAGAGALVVAGLGVGGDEVREFLVYCRGFLKRPADAGEALALVRDHARGMGRFFWQGAPVLTVLALAAAPFAGRGAGRALWLGLPLAGTFLVAGKPYVGLLMPVYLALGAVVVAAAARAAAAGRGTAVTVGLTATLAAQVALALPEVVERSRAPDEKRIEARRIADALPVPGVVFAATNALHIRWYTRRMVVALPDVVHRAAGGQGDAADRARAIRDEAARHARLGRHVYVTLDALLYLDRRWGIAPSELVPEGADVIRLDGDPPLALARIAGPAAAPARR